MNNWTQEDLDGLIGLQERNTLSYLIVGKELAPSTGTPHLQGYLETPKRVIGRTLLKKLPKGIFLAKANGTQKQNLTYVMKDGDWQEWGTKMNQGKRADLIGMKEAIDAGEGDELQLAEMNFGSWCRYRESLHLS